jgi:hypothetical protein
MVQCMDSCTVQGYEYGWLPMITRCRSGDTANSRRARRICSFLTVHIAQQPNHRHRERDFETTVDAEDTPAASSRCDALY